MNVTVMVPHTLRTAVEGRRRVELGLPASADVGDLLEALFKLYPKLRQHMANEGATQAAPMSVCLPEPAVRELANRRNPLKEGQTLYLVAPPQKSASAAAAGPRT
jgi:hypothetical protein